MFVKLSNSEILSLPSDIITKTCKAVFDHWFALYTPPNLPLFSAFENSKKDIEQHLPNIGMITMQTGKPVITYWGQKLEQCLPETIFTTEHISKPVNPNCPIATQFLEVSNKKKPAHLSLDARKIDKDGIYELLLLPICWIPGQTEIKPIVTVVMDEIKIDDAGWLRRISDV